MANEDLKELDKFTKSLRTMPLGDLIALLIDIKITVPSLPETLTDKATRSIRMKEVQNEISRRQVSRKDSEAAPLTKVGVTSLGNLF